MSLSPGRAFRPGVFRFRPAVCPGFASIPAFSADFSNVRTFRGAATGADHDKAAGPGRVGLAKRSRAPGVRCDGCQVMDTVPYSVDFRVIMSAISVGIVRVMNCPTWYRWQSVQSSPATSGVWQSAQTETGSVSKFDVKTAGS